jgi:regulator of nonsense transcripts 2
VQNDLIKIETKLRNIKFIAELTKFGVSAPQLALECLSFCLESFIGHNLELIAALLETCGPYLTRQADESVTLKINNMLDILWRLKEKETLPQK